MRYLTSGEMVLGNFHQLDHQTQVVAASGSQSLLQVIQLIIKRTFGLLRSVCELNRLPDVKPWLLYWV